MVSGHHNVIQGNYIGVNLNGDAASPNLYSGIWLDGSDNVIGGTTAASRNVSSGNGHQGIALSGPRNTIIGNYLGTNADGNAAIPNREGIIAFGGAINNRIGGPSAGERNVASGNTYSGIALGDFGGTNVTGNLIQGNYIDVGPDGTTAVPNVGTGVSINGLAGNTVGGTDAGSGNIISGNGGSWHDDFWWCLCNSHNRKLHRHRFIGYQRSAQRGRWYFRFWICPRQPDRRKHCGSRKSYFGK